MNCDIFSAHEDSYKWKLQRVFERDRFWNRSPWIDRTQGLVCCCSLFSCLFLIGRGNRDVCFIKWIINHKTPPFCLFVTKSHDGPIMALFATHLHIRKHVFLDMGLKNSSDTITQ